MSRHADNGDPEAPRDETDARAVSPAFAHYDSTAVRDLWARPGLSPRVRSLVTVAALVARTQSEPLPGEVRRALDNGVNPTEISELIAHLGFYASWPAAQSAITAIAPVYEERDIDTSQLPAGQVEALALDEAAEAQRRAAVEASYGTIAPGVVQQTTDVLFRDLWLRPGLAPRDRSLVTVSALIASGQSAQVTFHLGRAMDNGLTQAEASEALTQLAYYAGWPTVFTAMPVVKEVFEQRGR